MTKAVEGIATHLTFAGLKQAALAVGDAWEGMTDQWHVLPSPKRTHFQVIHDWSGLAVDTPALREGQTKVVHECDSIDAAYEYAESLSLEAHSIAVLIALGVIKDDDPRLEKHGTCLLLKPKGD